MRLLKTMAAAALSLALAFSLSGCNTETKQAKSDPESIVANAREKISAVKNLTAVINTDIEMASNGTRNSLSQKSESSYFFDPLLVKSVVTSSDSTDPNMARTTYVFDDKGSTTEYFGTSGQWVKRALSKENALLSIRHINAKENAATLLSNMTNLEALPDETINDKDVYVLKGSIPAEKVNTVAEETAALQDMSMTGLEPKYYEGVTALDVTFCFDKESGYPVKYQVSLSNILQTLTDNLVKSFDNPSELPKLEVIKYNMTVSMDTFGDAKKFEIPKEALAADEFNPDTFGGQIPVENADQLEPQSTPNDQSAPQDTQGAPSAQPSIDLGNPDIPNPDGADVPLADLEEPPMD